MLSYSKGAWGLSVPLRVISVFTEDEVILWGQVGVQKDLTISKGTIVLGQSGITKSIKAGTYFGTPAKDAREKMKELAYLGKLPELFDKVR